MTRIAIPPALQATPYLLIILSILACREPRDLYELTVSNSGPKPPTSRVLPRDRNGPGKALLCICGPWKPVATVHTSAKGY